MRFDGGEMREEGCGLNREQGEVRDDDRVKEERE